MYKYKQTLDVEVGDLVTWTDISKYHDTLTKDKFYQVTNHPDQNTLNVINDKGNKNSYGKGFGFKVLQTKPASEAVVGDYMYRITSGSDAFPQHTINKITETMPRYLYYKAGHSVLHNEVIVIAQAESEVKYPLFMQWKDNKDLIVKFDFKTSGTVISAHPDWDLGEYHDSFVSHTDPRWKPCDFTNEPDIDDIDWWQARFEAGLPVYAIESYGTVFLCKNIQPNQWYRGITFSMTDPSLVQQAPVSNSCNKIHLGATTDCNLQPITKEQTMNKTTLKLLLELLGASEEVKDATNSKFVGIITNEDEYVGYMYFDSKEDATECMAQPKMELHKLHLFEKSCVLAQKPRKVIELN